MAEKLKHVERGAEKPEHVEIHVNRKETLSSREREGLGKEQEKAESEARQTAEKLAVHSAETASKKEGYADSEKSQPVLNKSYKSVMHRVERQLPTYQRVFSKVIRSPSIDKASIIVGETVARPSAIIGAAFFAFVGLAVFGYVARNVGFELPNTLFPLLVVGGWVFGLAAEALFRLGRRILGRSTSS